MLWQKHWRCWRRKFKENLTPFRASFSYLSTPPRPRLRHCGQPGKLCGLLSFLPSFFLHHFFLSFFPFLFLSFSLSFSCFLSFFLTGVQARGTASLSHKLSKCLVQWRGWGGVSRPFPELCQTSSSRRNSGHPSWSREETLGQIFQFNFIASPFRWPSLLSSLLFSSLPDMDRNPSWECAKVNFRRRATQVPEHSICGRKGSVDEWWPDLGQKLVRNRGSRQPVWSLVTILPKIRKAVRRCPWGYRIADPRFLFLFFFCFLFVLFCFVLFCFLLILFSFSSFLIFFSFFLILGRSEIWKTVFIEVIFNGKKPKDAVRGIKNLSFPGKRKAGDSPPSQEKSSSRATKVGKFAQFEQKFGKMSS